MTDADAHRLANGVCCALHLLSHALHAVSDLHMNMGARPRTLRARLLGPSQGSSLFHTTMPFQSQFHLGPPPPQPTTEMRILSGRMTSGTTPTSATSTTSQAPTSGSTAPSGGGGPFGTTGPALLTAQSPVVFMELGPGSITIDSISTAVINDLPAPLDRIVDQPENGGAPASSAATEEGSASQSGPASSQARAQPTGAATVTTSSGTTGTRASPGSFRGLTPLSFPLGSALGGALGNSFDPCLPCNSFWTHNGGSQGQLAGGGGGGGSSQGSRASQQGPTQAPSANQHDDQLHQMLNGLMSALLHQPHLVLQRQHVSQGGSSEGGGGGRPRATLAGMMQGRSRHMSMRQTPLVYRGSGPTAATAATGPSTAPAELGQNRRLGSGGSFWSSSSSGSTQQGPSSATAGQQQPVEKQPASAESSAREANSTASSTSAATERPAARANLGLEGTTLGLPGMLAPTYSLQGSLANTVEVVLHDYCWEQNLVDTTRLLEVFVEDNVVTTELLGEEFATNVLAGLSRVLTAADLVSLLGGQQLERLDQLQCLLQLAVVQHLTPDVTEDLPQLVGPARDALLTRWAAPLIQDMQARGNIKPNVDVEATISGFLSERLHAVLLYILGPSQENFGEELLSLLRVAVSDLVALAASCFEDGTESLNTVFHAKVDPMLSVLGQHLSCKTQVFFGGWVGAFWQRVLDGVSSSATAALAAKYLVQHNPPGALSSDQAAPLEDMDLNLSDPSLARNGAENLSDGGAANAVSENRPPHPPLDEEPLPVILGSESWHASVPSEWVPIITRDIQRQRRQATQPPFSDAYFCGMPSKRRKMMNGGSAGGSAGVGPGSLTEALQRAVQRAGVRAPRGGMETFLAEARQNPALQAAHKLQLRQALRERLSSDPDFRPERFPNAHKFYYSADP